MRLAWAKTLVISSLLNLSFWFNRAIAFCFRLFGMRVSSSSSLFLAALSIKLIQIKATASFNTVLVSLVSASLLEFSPGVSMKLIFLSSSFGA